jgi:hypothetical protein
MKLPGIGQILFLPFAYLHSGSDTSIRINPYIYIVDNQMRLSQNQMAGVILNPKTLKQVQGDSGDSSETASMDYGLWTIN